MQIEYASINRSQSFSEAIRSVCKERKYLANTTGFSDDGTLEFVKSNIKNQVSQYFAIENDRVIGWCDITPKPQELHAHVGVLGMGVLDGYRGKGIGRILLEKTIEHAKTKGLERIELEVYESNKNAQKLYTKIGFQKEGLKIKAKKLDGEYENVVMMALLLK